MKFCPHCKRNLSTSSFHKRKRNNRITLQSWCKECQKGNSKRYYNNHSEYWKTWRVKNKDKSDISNKRYREKHREKLKVKAQKWNKENPEYSKIWKKNNPEKIKEIRKRHREKNRDKLNIKTQKWFKEHPLYKKIWRKTEKGKQERRRHHARRKKFGYIELWSNPFPEEIKVDYHHINDMLVIPIPRKLHESVPGNINHRERVSNIIFRLYCVDINIFTDEI